MNDAPLRVWAVLPTKAFARAKSRLSEAFDQGTRARLARNMFEHVLLLTRSVDGLTGTLVITDGDDVAELAARHGARVLRDPAPNTTLAVIVDHALATLSSEADAALVLMTDLPRATIGDLAAMLDALPHADLVLAGDARGHHTNALALRLRHNFTTRFGARESLSEHLVHARALGLRVARVDREGLAHDIDLASDLEQAEHALLSAVTESQRA